ncbi:MAG: LacI family DNA-binding transcriptional regulator [Planctomycetota bacterium]
MKKPGPSGKRHKRVTISQVAEEAGVARATAAFVISGRAEQLRISQQTIKRVQAVAKRLGYVPNQLARGMITGRTQVVGVILGGVWGKFGQYAIEGIREVLDAEGYTPFLTIHSWDEAREAREIDTLLRMRVDGVIVMPQITSRKDCYEPLVKQQVPVVFFGDVPFDIPGALVAAWDVRPALRLLLEHLAGRGCRRIGLVGERYFKFSRERYQVFKKTIRALGLTHDPKWDIWAEVGDPEHPEWGQAIVAMPDRPDAIVALNDNSGLQMLGSLRRHGLRVPEDIRIAALGDTIETVEASAQLTAIREPVREIGRAAATLVLEAIRDPALPPTERLVDTAELIVRMSTC